MNPHWWVGFLSMCLFWQIMTLATIILLFSIQFSSTDYLHILRVNVGWSQVLRPFYYQEIKRTKEKAVFSFNVHVCHWWHLFCRFCLTPECESSWRSERPVCTTVDTPKRSCPLLNHSNLRDLKTNPLCNSDQRKNISMNVLTNWLTRLWHRENARLTFIVGSKL